MPPRMGAAPKPTKTQTVEWDAWEGLNLTDARTAIKDEEFAWLENALTGGSGAVRLLPRHGEPVATVAAGIATAWGVVLDGVPLFITINGDGSISQITPGGIVTVVAGAGAVSPAAHVTMWRGSPVLIVDPAAGYSSWDGTLYTVLDPTLTGTSIAVFEGRVWIAKGRLIKYSAPASFSDFTAPNGGGSSEITDEAFPGDIVALASALEQLWVVGQSAIEAIANVTAVGTPPTVTTSFSTTNIVSGIGSNASQSVLGYFRALAFLSPVGVYALSGVTPQKLSDKLEDLFTDLQLTPAISGCIATLENFQCLLFLVTYTGTQSQAGAGPRPLLIGFKQGRWFLASQGPLTWVTTLVVDGVAQAWGTDGPTLYRLFAAAADVPVGYKVQSKLYHFGKRTQAKALLKVGFEFQAAHPVNPTLTVDSQSQSQVVPLTVANQITGIVNEIGTVMTLINDAGDALTILSQGIVLSRNNCNLFGNYLGWTVQGDDPPYRIQAVEFEVVPTREWQTPAA